MANITGTVFSRPVFGRDKPGDQQKAAAGFTQIFTSMMAGQMRRAMVGADKGVMGTSGGASGEIYGALMDQALGKTLAGSRAMARMRATIGRSLSRSARATGGAGSRTYPYSAIVRAQNVAQLQSALDSATPGSRMSPAMSRFGSIVATADVDRGPILAPPMPSSTASFLPPPSDLKD